jgi:hypothetical protein
MNSALQDLKWGFMMMERGIIDVKVRRKYPNNSHGVL